tara:strand:+ start:403 stop:591 length:189 start_codon:yes stop_codon:yes gene_type:complete
MGSGFQYNEEDHEKFSYNSLLTVKPEEENTMRTCYLVRDCWNDDQIVKLRDYINSIIESRKE